ncbi:von Willebrand domain-containing protein [Halenospora varia]|nr:von Willebrand domain-containing protein [Halenospora varia]
MTSFCGCYYFIASAEYYKPRHFLPLVSSSAQTTILSTTSRTTLTQKFTNPSATDAIAECVYTFPLYDGVSVVSFTCHIGKKVLRGLVKEKNKAKAVFDDAVSKGETAGLLTQADESADVFSTKLGNIAAGETILVEITYVGELKHHDTDGIRFTIPTRIAPRYGSSPVVPGLPAVDGGGIEITVDINMPTGSFIKGVQSPSHPIAVSMGTLSTASNAEPVMNKASATLSLGTAALEKDFVLIVQSKDVGIPKAMLETHPTIPNHRAIMATLTPKFSLRPSKPEIVFVADRSGSMGGNIVMLVSAMKVFLKSMPAGVKFNICSFGSSHSFLWPKSKTYAADTLQEATQHLTGWSANFGGTETFQAVKATIDRRFTDLALEVMLLTDGDIWQQQELFSYIDEQVESSKGKIRVFPLGIGSGVSHSLIEGLARHGNGFAQAVQSGERLDNSVVRMLRGALSPHITDYTFEVKYEQGDDDFEVIDKVTEGMKVLLTDGSGAEKVATPKPTISLFDSSTDPEKDNIKGGEDPTAHLPKIPIPKVLQAPHKIPSLFAFSRTSVYLLLSPETFQKNPTAVIFRASSDHGPLALEIPIEVLPSHGETIHQLAAKKAVQGLEEGGGWIFDAEDQNGKLVKDRYPSNFEDLVKKEAVRLGEKFQVAGKWCSFVAVSANDREIDTKEAMQMVADGSYENICEQEADLCDLAVLDSSRLGSVNQAYDCSTSSMPVKKAKKTGMKGFRQRILSNSPKTRTESHIQSFGSFGSPPPPPSEAPGVFPMASFAPPPAPSQSNSASSFAMFSRGGRGSSSGHGAPNIGRGSSILFGGMTRTSRRVPSPPSEEERIEAKGGFKLAPVQQQQALPVFGASASNSSREPLFANSASSGGPPGASGTYKYGAMREIALKANRRFVAQSVDSAGSTMNGSSYIPGHFRKASDSTTSPVSPSYSAASPGYSPASPRASWSFSSKKSAENASPVPSTPQDKLHRVIALQSFDGSWPSSCRGEIATLLALAIPTAAPGVDEDIWMTMVVITFLENKMADEEGTWGLVVEKARDWLASCENVDIGSLEQTAMALVKN